jgi:hypothetical protein
VVPFLGGVVVRAPVDLAEAALVVVVVVVVVVEKAERGEGYPPFPVPVLWEGC